MLKNAVMGVMLLSLTLGCSLPVQAAAQQESQQVAEATLFFSRVVQQTRNPVIAEYAKKSLEKLQQNPESLTIGKRQVEVPLMTKVSKSPTVPVTINDTVKATLIVDTGASYTVITPRMAKKLGVPVDRSTRRIQIVTANGLVNAPIVTLDSVNIGGINVRNVDVVVQDLGNDLLFAGLLGMNFFKNLDLTIQPDKLIIGVR